jgi:magnesium chelatase family protein
MALFRTRAAAIFGIDAHLIDVEVDMYPGQNRDFITVGMPETAVREKPRADQERADEFRFRLPQQKRHQQLGASQCAEGRSPV